MVNAAAPISRVISEAAHSVSSAPPGADWPCAGHSPSAPLSPISSRLHPAETPRGLHPAVTGPLTLWLPVSPDIGGILRYPLREPGGAFSPTPGAAHPGAVASI